MALLFMDGFDHYTGSNPVSAVGKWGSHINVDGTSLTSPQGGGRTGSTLKVYSDVYGVLTKPLPASGGFVLGFALYITGAPSGSDFLLVREGTINHLVLSMTAGGLIQVKVGTTVVATGTTVFTLNSWRYIEFKGVIHDTAGSYEVHVDGVLEPGLQASGIDTRNGGATGQWDRVGVNGINNSGAGSGTFFDDFYVCDLSGTLRNDFLGPIKIDLLMPQPGNGSNVGLTPSTGTDHGAMVDEIPPNTTDYNSGAAVGLKDTYNLTNPTLNGAILGIQVSVFAAKSDVAGRKICTVVRAGGVDYEGNEQNLTTTFGYLSGTPRPQNPNTLADWAVAEVTALEAGMKVTV